MKEKLYGDIIQRLQEKQKILMSALDDQYQKLGCAIDMHGPGNQADECINLCRNTRAKIRNVQVAIKEIESL